jgi:hypothetical protein
MVIHDGKIDRIGAPLEVSNRYLEINMRAAAATREDGVGDYAARFADVIADPPVEIVEARLEGEHIADRTLVAEREPLEVVVVAQVKQAIERPGFQFRIDDARGQALFHGGSADLELRPGRVQPGETLEVTISVDNRLAAGDYSFTGGLTQRLPDGSSEPATPSIPLNLTVTGDRSDGLLSLDQEVRIRREPKETGSEPLAARVQSTR